MAAKREWLDSERAQQLMDDALAFKEVHNRVFGDGDTEILHSSTRGALYFAIAFMRQVIRTKDVSFRIVDRNGRKKAIEASTLARYFGLLGGMARLYSRRYGYSPLLDLFFGVYAKHAIRQCDLRTPSRQFDNCSIEGEVFDDFIRCLREEGARVGIVNKVNDWENTSDENDQNVRQYLEALFDKHGSLLPVYVDLFYESSCVGKEQVSEFVTEMEREQAEDMAFLCGNEAAKAVGMREPLPQREVATVITDRNRLCTNMRAKPSIFGSVVGQVWRIEWAYTGFYLRIVLLFDGSTPTTDLWLGDQIGQYWVESITEGRGSFRNLSRSRGKLPDAPVVAGEIQKNDRTRRERLTRALCCMARRDRYVVVKSSSKCKRFGMGRRASTKPEKPKADGAVPRLETYVGFPIGDRVEAASVEAYQG